MVDPETPPGLPPTLPPKKAIRVVVQHSPTLFNLLGLVHTAECAPVLHIGLCTYAKVRDLPTYVLYAPVEVTP